MRQACQPDGCSQRWKKISRDNFENHENQSETASFFSFLTTTHF